MTNIKDVFNIRGNLIMAIDEKHSFKNDDILIDQNGDTYTVISNVTTILGLNDLYVTPSKNNKVNQPKKVSLK